MKTGLEAGIEECAGEGEWRIFNGRLENHIN